MFGKINKQSLYQLYNDCKTNNSRNLQQHYELAKPFLLLIINE